MKLASAHIRGFRSASEVTVDFNDLTALVGSSGADKSTILNAPDWFFTGGDLADRDLHHALYDFLVEVLDAARTVVM